VREQTVLVWSECQKAGCIGGSVKLKPLQNILQYKLINYSGLHIRAQWRKQQLVPLRSGRPWAPCATQAHKDSRRNTGLWLQLNYIYAILLLQALCKHPQCTCQRCYACIDCNIYPTLLLLSISQIGKESMKCLG